MPFDFHAGLQLLFFFVVEKWGPFLFLKCPSKRDTLLIQLSCLCSGANLSNMFPLFNFSDVCPDKSRWTSEFLFCNSLMMRALAWSHPVTLAGAVPASAAAAGPSTAAEAVLTLTADGDLTAAEGAAAPPRTAPAVVGQ